MATKYRYSNAFWVLLLASLAFNLGIGVTFGIKRTVDDKPACRKPDKRPHHKRMFERLDLTEAQQEELKDSRKKLRSELRGLHDSMMEDLQALVELMMADAVDEEALDAKVAAIEVCRTEVHRLLIDHLLELKENLEPEQREALREFVESSMKRGGFGPIFGRGGRHGSGNHGWRGNGFHRGMNQQKDKRDPQQTDKLIVDEEDGSEVDQNLKPFEQETTSSGKDDLDRG